MLNSDELINKVKIYNKFLNPEKLNKAWIHPKTNMNINSLINQLEKVDYSDIRIV